MEPEQSLQLKYIWKTPGMVKPSVKTRSEAETETNQQQQEEVKHLVHSFVVAVV